MYWLSNSIRESVLTGTEFSSCAALLSDFFSHWFLTFARKQKSTCGWPIFIVLSVSYRTTYGTSASPSFCLDQLRNNWNASSEFSATFCSAIGFQQKSHQCRKCFWLVVMHIILWTRLPTQCKTQVKSHFCCEVYAVVLVRSIRLKLI